MKKKCNMILYVLLAGMLFGGCQNEINENNMAQEEVLVQEGTEKKEFFLAREDDVNVPIIEEVFSEETPYHELADFLVSYYQIPEEYQTDTRYYYNYVDINDDGVMEIMAIVIGKYTESGNGDPAVILSVGDAGEFTVLEAFPSVQTPVTISEQTTNGWHDIIYYAHGGNEESGYRICRYSPQGGYKTELSEIVKELEPVGGRQILSNNLIDDMDQGRYLTLAPQSENLPE